MYTVILICMETFSFHHSELKQELFDVKWIHSYEEDIDSIRVYRTEDYKFPPSRGRDAFCFRRDGRFEDYQIGKTDKIEIMNGEWKMIDPNTFEVSFPDTYRSTVFFVFIERTSEKLICRIR